MKALGIDLAASPNKTGAVAIQVDDGRWTAHELAGRLDDNALVQAVSNADVVGVDSPLGWPTAFVEAVAAHHDFRPWPASEDRSELTHRLTDYAVRPYCPRLPLSVSANMLGSVAMRCALLQRRWADEAWGEQMPRDGSGRLVEVYPAAALHQWKVPCSGYKSAARPTEARDVRAEIVSSLQEATASDLDLAEVAGRCVESDHVLDALLCALAALAAIRDATVGPDASQRTTANVEGWIHVPARRLDQFPWSGVGQTTA